MRSRRRLDPGLRDSSTRVLIVHEMRLHKSAAELELMRTPNDITTRGAPRGRQASRTARPSLRVRARGRARLHVPAPRRQRARPTRSIVGGGATRPSSTTSPTTSRCVEGEVVLIDAGAEYAGLRLRRDAHLPGRRALRGPAARDLYEVVLAAQLASLEASQGRARRSTEYPRPPSVRSSGRGHGRTSGSAVRASVDELIENEAYRPTTCIAPATGWGSTSTTWAVPRAAESRAPRKLEPGMVLHRRAGPLRAPRRSE